MMDEARKQMAREWPRTRLNNQTIRLTPGSFSKATPKRAKSTWTAGGRGLKAELERSRPAVGRSAGLSAISLYGRRFEHQAWRAFVKRSPKMMAN